MLNSLKNPVTWVGVCGGEGRGENVTPAVIAILPAITINLITFLFKGIQSHRWGLK